MRSHRRNIALTLAFTLALAACGELPQPPTGGGDDDDGFIPAPPGPFVCYIDCSHPTFDPAAAGEVWVTVYGVPRDMNPVIALHHPDGSTSTITTAADAQWTRYQVPAATAGAYRIEARTIGMDLESVTGETLHERPDGDVVRVLQEAEGALVMVQRENPISPLNRYEVVADDSTLEGTLAAGRGLDLVVTYAPHLQFTLDSAAYYNEIREELGFEPVRVTPSWSGSNWEYVRYRRWNYDTGDRYVPHHYFEDLPFATPEGGAVASDNNGSATRSFAVGEPVPPSHFTELSLRGVFHAGTMLYEHHTGWSLGAFATTSGINPDGSFERWPRHSVSFSGGPRPTPGTLNPYQEPNSTFTLWPARDTRMRFQKGLMIEFPSPHNDPLCRRVETYNGAPIMIQQPQQSDTNVTSYSFTIERPGGVLEDVDNCLLTEHHFGASYDGDDAAQAQRIQTARSVLHSNGLIGIIPIYPLEANATYHVSVTTSTREFNWSFFTSDSFDDSD